MTTTLTGAVVGTRRDGAGREALATIAGVSTVYPPHFYSQEEILAVHREVWEGRDVDLRKLARLYRGTRVEGRHLAFPLDAYRRPRPWGETNDLWIGAAEELGAEAMRGALDDAGLAPAEVDALVFVSVTGIATPSIDARLVNRLGLPSRTRRLPIFGLGCVAGAAGLARSADLIQAFPGGVVVLLSVELCSLTVQHDDLSAANMIAAGLFGDGAAAVVLTGSERSEPGPTIVATRSIQYPDTEHIMGWDISEKGFRLVLSPELPALIERYLPGDVDAFLADHGLRRSDIDHWMAHTGGPKVLSAMEKALELPDDALQLSRDQLRRVGNVSSASVLQVLGRTVEERRPVAGSLGLMLAMGPGFCCELLLVSW